MPAGRLADRTAIITGSGQNIGRATARLFASEGAAAVINGASNRVNVDNVVKEIIEEGGRAIGVMADVSEPDQVARLVAEAQAAFGTVDIAVNNVGRRVRQSFERA